MAVRPLRPATRHRLGELLPRLLADRTRVPPSPAYAFHLSAYGVLAAVSNCCPPDKDRSSRVTHPSATRLHSGKPSCNPVRLACVKHAASVHPEPGSNSPWLSLTIFRPTLTSNPDLPLANFRLLASSLSSMLNLSWCVLFASGVFRRAGQREAVYPAIPLSSRGNFIFLCFFLGSFF